MREEQLSPELGRLIDTAKAQAAQARSHAPKAEGAALLTGSGEVFAACSGMDAGPQAPCAVARAFAAAGQTGAEGVLAIALAATAYDRTDSFRPCDECRSFLATLDPELPMVTKQLGRWVVQPLCELCPDA